MSEIRKLAKEPQLPVDTLVESLDDAELERRIHVAAHLKRFFECFCGDEEFRAAVREDTASALAQRGLDVAPDDARAFLASNDPSVTDAPKWTENLQHYRDLLLQLQGGQELISMASTTHDERYSAWRRRQLARLRLEFSSAGDFIIRPPAAYELSKGCTAGCWFCAISAERFAGNFDYASGAPLWRGVLEAMKSTLGTSAESSFCYWATDSLDNPDYERFALDFHGTFGRFPATTTALALKNVARTRALIELSQRNGCRLNRFSVLTLAMMKRIHREFSPEELFLVELVLQNPGALIFYSQFPRTVPAAKIRAGRVMEDPTLAAKKNAPISDGTIACIVGFLINMVERSIRLVSPCKGSSEWPLGYRIHETRHFDSAGNFRAAIGNMIDRHMPVSIPSESVPRFLPGLEYTVLADGFRLSTLVHAVEFRAGLQPLKGLLFKEIGHMIRAGQRTAAEIEESGCLGMSTEIIRGALNEIYESGAIDDAPKFEAADPMISITPGRAASAHMEGMNS